MMLALVDEVNHTGTVTEMNMAQVTGGGEHIDRAVDRRRIHFGPDQSLNLLMEIRGRQVIVMSLGQDLADCPAGDGDAQAGGAKRSDEDVAIDVHR